jgi:hypothetical protein
MLAESATAFGLPGRLVATFAPQKAASGVHFGGWQADRDQTTQSPEGAEHPAPVTDEAESLGHGIESFRVHA